MTGYQAVSKKIWLKRKRGTRIAKSKLIEHPNRMKTVKYREHALQGIFKGMRRVWVETIKEERTAFSNVLPISSCSMESSASVSFCGVMWIVAYCITNVSNFLQLTRILVFKSLFCISLTSSSSFEVRFTASCEKHKIDVSCSLPLFRKINLHNLFLY